MGRGGGAKQMVNINTRQVENVIKKSKAGWELQKVRRREGGHPEA